MPGEHREGATVVGGSDGTSKDEVACATITVDKVALLPSDEAKDAGKEEEHAPVEAASAESLAEPSSLPSPHRTVAHGAARLGAAGGAGGAGGPAVAAGGAGGPWSPAASAYHGGSLNESDEDEGMVILGPKPTYSRDTLSSMHPKVFAKLQYAGSFADFAPFVEGITLENGMMSKLKVFSSDTAADGCAACLLALHDVLTASKPYYSKFQAEAESILEKMHLHRLLDAGMRGTPGYIAAKWFAEFVYLEFQIAPSTYLKYGVAETEFYCLPERTQFSVADTRTLAEYLARAGLLNALAVKPVQGESDDTSGAASDMAVAVAKMKRELEKADLSVDEATDISARARVILADHAGSMRACKSTKVAAAVIAPVIDNTVKALELVATHLLGSASKELRDRGVECVRTIVNHGVKALHPELLFVVRGLTSVGKSTFIAALVGHDLLPSDESACTVVLTRLRHRAGCKQPTMHLVAHDLYNKTVRTLRRLILSVDCSFPGVQAMVHGKPVIQRLLQSIANGSVRFEAVYQGVGRIREALEEVNAMYRLIDELKFEPWYKSRMETFNDGRDAMGLEHQPIIDVEFAILAKTTVLGDVVVVDCPGDGTQGVRTDIALRAVKAANKVILVDRYSDFATHDREVLFKGIMGELRARNAIEEASVTGTGGAAGHRGPSDDRLVVVQNKFDTRASSGITEPDARDEMYAALMHEFRCDDLITRENVFVASAKDCAAATSAQAFLRATGGVKGLIERGVEGASKLPKHVVDFLERSMGNNWRAKLYDLDFYRGDAEDASDSDSDADTEASLKLLRKKTVKNEVAKGIQTAQQSSFLAKIMDSVLVSSSRRAFPEVAASVSEAVARVLRSVHKVDIQQILSLYSSKVPIPDEHLTELKRRLDEMKASVTAELERRRERSSRFEEDMQRKADELVLKHVDLRAAKLAAAGASTKSYKDMKAAKAALKPAMDLAEEKFASVMRAQETRMLDFARQELLSDIAMMSFRVRDLRAAAETKEASFAAAASAMSVDDVRSSVAAIETALQRSVDAVVDSISEEAKNADLGEDPLQAYQREVLTEKKETTYEYTYYWLIFWKKHTKTTKKVELEEAEQQFTSWLKARRASKAAAWVAGAVAVRNRVLDSTGASCTEVFDNFKSTVEQYQRDTEGRVDMLEDVQRADEAIGAFLDGVSTP